MTAHVTTAADRVDVQARLEPGEEKPDERDDDAADRDRHRERAPVADPEVEGKALREAEERLRAVGVEAEAEQRRRHPQRRDQRVDPEDGDQKPVDEPHACADRDPDHDRPLERHALDLEEVGHHRRREAHVDCHREVEPADDEGEHLPDRDDEEDPADSGHVGRVLLGGEDGRVECREDRVENGDPQKELELGRVGRRQHPQAPDGPFDRAAGDELDVDDCSLSIESRLRTAPEPAPSYHVC